mgnify:CR=1 FL=1
MTSKLTILSIDPETAGEDVRRMQEALCLLEQLRQLGVRMESVNREKYLALLADIYQYDAGNMLYRPDAELDQMVRSDAVKYSVS